jgi:hypothetical protein
VQRVQNHWALTADLRAQCLAQRGFVVIKCDNRGSFRRYPLCINFVRRCGGSEARTSACIFRAYRMRGLCLCAWLGG